MSLTRWGLLPDVIGIGPARTGTTWLYDKLSDRVDLPRGLKESKFFDRYHTRGIEWYASLFQHCKGDRPIAEICPYLAGPRLPNGSPRSFQTANLSSRCATRWTGCIRIIR